MADLKVVSPSEVAKHTTSSDCWFIISGKVYNVTEFLLDHPGGEDALLNVAGKDGTEDFEDVGHSDSAKEQMKQFLVGVVEGYQKVETTANKSAADVPVMRPVTAQVVAPEGSKLGRFILPLLLLALAFALRFFTKKDVEKQQ